jgi:hypothetical protein
VRLLDRYDDEAGRAASRALAALDEELGPFTSKLLRLEASRTALAWSNLELASRALAAARRIRATGKGPRPSLADIERLARRQARSDRSYAQALDRLREMVKGNGHAYTPATPSSAAAAARAALSARGST